MDKLEFVNVFFLSSQGFAAEIKVLLCYQLMLYKVEACSDLTPP